MAEAQRYKHGWIKVGGTVETAHGPAKVLEAPTPAKEAVKVKYANPPGKKTGDATEWVHPSAVHGGTGAKARAEAGNTSPAEKAAYANEQSGYANKVGTATAHQNAASKHERAAAAATNPAAKAAHLSKAKEHLAKAAVATKYPEHAKAMQARVAAARERINKAKGTNMANELDELTMELAVPLNLRAKARAAAAKKGEALPDGSFPIRNKVQLEKAKRAIGRANPAKRGKVKAFIAKRAKALGVKKK